MDRVTIFLVALGGVGCGGGGGGDYDLTNASETLQSAISGCLGLPAARRDVCVVLALEATQQLEGPDAMVLCDQMVDQDAEDRCIELAMRCDIPPPDGVVCDRIADDRLRFSCWLSVADKTMSGEIADSLKICDAAGPLFDHCLYHIATHRRDVWVNTGLAGMTKDVAYLVQNVPGIEHKESFGYSIGTVAAGLGAQPGYIGPCVSLPFGAARLACENALRNFDPSYGSVYSLPSEVTGSGPRGGGAVPTQEIDRPHF